MPFEVGGNSQEINKTSSELTSGFNPDSFLKNGGLADGGDTWIGGAKLPGMDKPDLPEINKGGDFRTYDPDVWIKSPLADSSYEKTIKESRTDIVETREHKGGSYGDLRDEGHGWNHQPPEEVHHMPSWESEAEKLGEYRDGPAIAMDYDDHRQTASCGNSREAREYRTVQKELIESGNYEDAMQMDIDDIHEKFGDKYDAAIAEMKEYYNQLKESGRV